MLRIRFNPLGLMLGALLGACSDSGGSDPSTAGTGGASIASNMGGSTTAAGTGGSSVTTGGSAGTGQGGSSSADLVSFDDDVHPILSSKCVPCHEASTAGIPGHAALDQDAAFDAVQGMSMGQPVYLRILARASGEDPAGFMPPEYAGCEDGLGAGNCLTVEEFELIELWVEQGASHR
jgi:hypothetical protein